MSVQLDKIKEVYEADVEGIKSAIIAIANRFVDKDLESDEAYKFMFNDGTSDPFTESDDLGQEYADLISDLGNTEDETTFLNEVWIDTLVNTDPVKYSEIITKFIDICDNGL